MAWTRVPGDMAVLFPFYLNFLLCETGYQFFIQYQPFTHLEPLSKGEAEEHTISPALCATLAKTPKP